MTDQQLPQRPWTRVPELSPMAPKKERGDHSRAVLNAHMAEGRLNDLAPYMAEAILIVTMPEEEFTDEKWDAGWHDLERVAEKLREIGGKP